MNNIEQPRRHDAFCRCRRCKPPLPLIYGEERAGDPIRGIMIGLFVVGIALGVILAIMLAIKSQ